MISLNKLIHSVFNVWNIVIWNSLFFSMFIRDKNNFTFSFLCHFFIRSSWYRLYLFWLRYWAESLICERVRGWYNLDWDLETFIIIRFQFCDTVLQGHNNNFVRQQLLCHVFGRQKFYICTWSLMSSDFCWSLICWALIRWSLIRWSLIPWIIYSEITPFRKRYYFLMPFNQM